MTHTPDDDTSTICYQQKWQIDIFAQKLKQACGMSLEAERLADAVRRRRVELDLNQIEVWQSGGPSNTTLTEIENARVERLTRITARKLDAGLQWEPGSARQVWEGGKPVPTGAAPPRDEFANLRQRTLRSSLSPQRKTDLLEALEALEADERRRGLK